MRVVRALCAILIVMTCAPILAGGQRDRGLAAPGDGAFPPKPLPPLYVPKQFDGLATPVSPLPAGPEGVEQVRLVRQQPPEGEFRPISELPPEERVPAVRLVVAAYVFVVLALFVYVTSIARRLNAVAREIAKLDAQLKRQ